MPDNGRQIRRILIVSDSSAIAQSYYAAITDDVSNGDSTNSTVLSPPAGQGRSTGLEPECVGTTIDALDRVRQAAASSANFAIVFLTMPVDQPQDAVALAQHLWDADPALQVVICVDGDLSRYNAAIAPLATGDQLLIQRLPICATQIRQLAAILGEKWDLATRVRSRLMESQRLTNELQSANQVLSREIDERKAMECQLRHYAYFDSLTGLPNRACLMRALQDAIARSRTQGDYRFAALFLDLDNFKLINDSLGHDAGDMLLLEVANRLRSSLRSIDTVVRLDNDTAARIGGDEFVIILDGIKQPSDAAFVAERLLEQFARPFQLRTQLLSVGVSIGITLSDHAYDGADDVLRDADTAMYRAKAAGKSRYSIFNRGMHEAARGRLHLENELRRKIDTRDFVLAYQPIVALPSRSIVGFEALVRWNNQGERPPSEFIPVAEETGLIVGLGRQVIEQAGRQLAQWHTAFGSSRRIRMNVNVSRRQLMEPDFATDLRHALSGLGIHNSAINLEVTESAVIDDFDAARARLEQLKALGVGIHLDDFGTGYSSLSCLHRFPLDVVKIDQEFTADLAENPDYAAVVRAIVTLAHSLGMKVTIEGIENAAQLAQAVTLQCDFAQGYYFAKPLPAADATVLLAKDIARPQPAESA